MSLIKRKVADSTQPSTSGTCPRWLSFVLQFSCSIIMVYLGLLCTFFLLAGAPHGGFHPLQATVGLVMNFLVSFGGYVLFRRDRWMIAAAFNFPGVVMVGLCAYSGEWGPEFMAILAGSIVGLISVLLGRYFVRWRARCELSN